MADLTGGGDGARDTEPVGRRRGLRFKLAAVVVALAVFGGGVLLGVDLQDASPSTATGATSPASPAVAGGGGSSAGAGSGAGGAPTPVHVACTTLSGDLSGLPALGGCTDAAVTGGSGAATEGSLGKAGSITVAWNGTGTTTFVFWSTRPTPSRDRCPAGGTELVLHGSVTAGSPVGRYNGGVKGNIGAKVCVDAADRLSLLPGHTFKL